VSEKFLIAPFSSGLVKNLPVWQTPEESFYELENAYVHRGVIKKRFGSKYIGAADDLLLGQLKSRLRVHVGTTDGNGDISDTVPAGSVLKAGQMFSISDEIFTVPEVGLPVTMLTTGAATTHTYDTDTGAFVFVGATAATKVYWYPSEPVMGLTLYEAGSINNHSAIAFDTRFVYRYTSAGWGRVGAQIYKADTLDYFSSTNFSGVKIEDTALFATNFYKNEANSDSMYYTLDGITWAVFRPKFYTAGAAPENTVITAKIVKPFKSRLLLFDTYEYYLAGTAYKSFKNRVRYSSVNGPLSAYGWLVAKQTGYIGGGWIDAPTEQEIISVQYVKDRMIVYFERSTYELVYTGNESLPFIWQKLSSDLGATATFGSVPFESGCLAIGSTGVHSCNGVTVTRADNKIPDEIFTFLNISDAVKRVYGIKDYFEELFYWSIPNPKMNDVSSYPDTLLVYNYENQSWATFDDSITCFGYFEQTLSATWEDDYRTWEDDTNTWGSGTRIANHRQVLAGNQQGFVFTMDHGSNSNASVLQVSKVDGETLTVIDHNLSTNDYVRLYNSGVEVQDIIYRVYDTPTVDTIILEGIDLAAYAGGATLARVSRVSIKSTAWNPYSKQGFNVNLHKITFAVKKTVSGEISVNYNPSQSNLDMIEYGEQSGAWLGTNVLETFPYDLVPLEASQSLLWHSVYFQGQGNSIQIHLTWSDKQMKDINIVGSALVIEGIILNTSSAGSMG